MSRDPAFVAKVHDVVGLYLHPPESEWLLVDAIAPVAADGLIGAQARAWSPAGQLLASGGGQLPGRPLPARC